MWQCLCVTICTRVRDRKKIGKKIKEKNKNHFSSKDLARACTLRFSNGGRPGFKKGKNAKRRREEKMKRMGMPSDREVGVVVRGAEV